MVTDLPQVLGLPHAERSKDESGSFSGANDDIELFLPVLLVMMLQRIVMAVDPLE